MARRLHFPSLVADGDNPRAKAVSFNPNGTIKDGVGGDASPWMAVPESMCANGPRWCASGDLMFAAMFPSLKPSKAQMGKIRKS
jgi:hypothetical protein